MNAHPYPTGLIARYVGASGGSTTRYYWIQAIYQSGLSKIVSVLVTTPASLTTNDRVCVTWNPMPGAIAYNVYMTTTSTAPSSGSIVVALGETSNSITDTGQSNSLTTGVVAVGGLKEAVSWYDFATHGGAQGAITPSNGDVIPAGSLIVFANTHVQLACTSGGSATVAVGFVGSTAVVLAATAVASLTLNATLVGVCNATPVRIASALAPTFTIATADLTAGRIETRIFYLVPSKLA
jgi:hypothetical protein